MPPKRLKCHQTLPSLSADLKSAWPGTPQKYLGLPKPKTEQSVSMRPPPSTHQLLAEAMKEKDALKSGNVWVEFSYLHINIRRKLRNRL